MRSIGTLIVLGVLAAPAAAQSARTPVPASGQTTQPARTSPPPPAEMKGQPAPQGFSVVLVLGDLTGNSNADANVPPAARKALNDMKDFLPYKGYRLLDAEWILGSHAATTRLRGPDGQDYELTLNNTAMASPSGAKQRVTFRLREGAGDSGSGTELTMATARMAERSALEQRIQELEREIAATQRSGEKNAEAAARAKQLAELRQHLDSEPRPMASVYARGRWIIDTSFEMEIGETVVVGTSRLKDTGKDSGRALIALLTAVPKGGAAPKQE